MAIDRVKIADIVYNLTGVTKFRQGVLDGAEKHGRTNPIFARLIKGAEIYKKYLTTRYYSLANRGYGPGWPDITEEWREKKGSMGYDTRTLIMKGQLVNSFRVYKRNPGGVFVGIWGRSHWRFDGWGGYPATREGLADFLQNHGVIIKDTGRNKKWKIMVPPTIKVRKEVTRQVQMGINVMVRDANRKAEERRRKRGE